MRHAESADVSEVFPLECGSADVATRRIRTKGTAEIGTRIDPISIDDDLDEIEDDVMVTTSARGKLQSFRCVMVSPHSHSPSQVTMIAYTETFMSRFSR